MTAFLQVLKEDIGLLKWKLALFVFCFLLSVLIVYLCLFFADEAANNLRIAESNLQGASISIESIEEEEATILEYLGRYQELEQGGVVSNKDRLQLIETITAIRDEYDLFPISVNSGEQVPLSLQYAPGNGSPGNDINLNISTVDISLPLLHEGDLADLLNSLLNSTELFQVTECNVSLRDIYNTTFVVLAQHQSANCNLLWYTFDLDPPETVYRGF